jgi:hypothetical protein
LPFLECFELLTVECCKFSLECSENSDEDEQLSGEFVENSGRQTPENLISRNSDSDENSLPSPLRRSFSLNSIRKKRSEKDISVTPSGMF